MHPDYEMVIGLEVHAQVNDVLPFGQGQKA